MSEQNPAPFQPVEDWQQLQGTICDQVQQNY